ncbi:MAG: hypothetical protein HC906_15790 [Bacteroidales bacterium]|nr:hypothetical protein [Bacteroidales bacterium]
MISSKIYNTDQIIDVTNLSLGIYFIKIYSTEGIQDKIIIKE